MTSPQTTPAGQFGHGQMFLFGRDRRVKILRPAATPARGYGWPGHSGPYVWVQTRDGRREARVPRECIRMDQP